MILESWKLMENNGESWKFMEIIILHIDVKLMLMNYLWVRMQLSTLVTPIPDGAIQSFCQDFFHTE
jgi:hypothetical protein